MRDIILLRKKITLLAIGFAIVGCVGPKVREKQPQQVLIGEQDVTLIPIPNVTGGDDVFSQTSHDDPVKLIGKWEEKIDELLDSGKLDEAQISVDELSNWVIKNALGTEFQGIALLYQGIMDVHNKNFENALVNLRSCGTFLNIDGIEWQYRYAKSLKFMGLSHYQLGQFESAAEVLKRSVVLFKLKGYDDPTELISVLSDLGVVYGELGNTTLQETVLLESLNNAIEYAGNGALVTASPMNNLCTLYGNSGRMEEALLYCRESLLVKGNYLAPDDPSYLLSIRNTGNSLDLAGKYAESLIYRKRLVEICEKPGAECPAGTAWEAKILMANLYRKLGQFQDAINIYEALLVQTPKSEGVHRNPIVLSNYSKVLTQLGRYEHSRILAEEALEARISMFGPNSLDVAYSKGNLGVWHARMANYDQAINLTEEAITVFRSISVSKPNIKQGHVSLLGNIGGYYMNFGMYDMAEEFLNSSLILNDSLGRDNLTTASTTLLNLATVYTELGKYALAETVYIDLIGGLEKAYGKEHLDLAEALGFLGALYHREGRFNDAEAIFVDCLRISREIWEPGHPNIGIALSNLGLAQYQVGQLADSGTSLREALDILEESYPASGQYFMGNTLPSPV